LQEKSLKAEEKEKHEYQGKKRRKVGHPARKMEGKRKDKISEKEGRVLRSLETYREKTKR